MKIGVFILELLILVMMEKKSTLFGIQHINTGKNKESFLGILQPVTGLMVTADNAAYIYTGFQIYNEGH